MEILVPIGIVAGIFTIVGIAAYRSYLAELERTAAIQEEVTQLGLQFYPEGDRPLQNRLARLKLFKVGRGQKISNLMLGETPDLNMAIFDFQYTTGSGKHRQTHRQTVIAMESEKLHIPNLEMRPERFIDRVGSMFGFHDINFEEHPEFSRAFVLKGTDESAVRQLLDWPILDFFVRHPTMCLETCEGLFVYFERGQRLRPENLRKQIELGYTIYHHLLRVVTAKT